MNYSKKFKKLIKNIIKAIEDYKIDKDHFNSEIELSLQKNEEIDPSIEDKLEFAFNAYKDIVVENFEKLREISIDENYYFFDCPFELYKKHFPKRKFNFLQKYTDITEADFIKEELKMRLYKEKERILTYNEKTVKYHDFIDETFYLESTEQKKIHFLENKLKLLGWDSECEENSWVDINKEYVFKKNEHNKDHLIDKVNLTADDFKSSKELSEYIVEKILELDYISEELFEDIRYRRDKNEDYYDVINKDEERIMSISEEIRLKIIKLIKELFYKSAEDDFYFFDCPFPVYKRTLSKRFDDYKNEFLDDEAINFLIKEKKNIDKNLNENRNFKYENDVINYTLYFDESDEVYKTSKQKKIEYLEKAINYEIKLVNELEGKLEVIEKEREKIEPEPKEEKNRNLTQVDNKKIKWSGSVSSLGYILAQLESLEYIKAPIKKGNDINYSEFARQVINSIDIKTTENTLQKYLNPESEKSQKIKSKFKDLNIPHKNITS